jgi:hypothetical protein
MKRFWTALFTLFSTTAVFIGCGAGHPTITSITVTPATASAPTSSQGQVGFSASGTFTNHQSRLLTVGDGLSWSSSNVAVVSITSLGLATCKMAGTVTITASAPANLQFTVGSGVNNTSATVTGTGMLTCT